MPFLVAFFETTPLEKASALELLAAASAAAVLYEE